MLEAKGNVVNSVLHRRVFRVTLPLAAGYHIRDAPLALLTPLEDVS
jgi:hypothetical protein